MLSAPAIISDGVFTIAMVVAKDGRVGTISKIKKKRIEDGVDRKFTRLLEIRCTASTED
jgi:hypothetical protein